MKRILAVVLLLAFCVPLSAKEKPHPDSDYQDGVLVSYREVQHGPNCSDGDCTSRRVRIYTVKVGDRTLGISHYGFRSSVLADKLPGYPMKLRFDRQHVFVKDGDQESRFQVVEAQ